MFNKLFQKEKTNFKNNFQELKSIMNNFINFWTSIRKEWFLKLKKNMRKITVKWLILERRLNKPSKRLNRWKKISLNLGMILSSLPKNINTDLSSRLILKSTKLTKISSLNLQILNCLRLEWENSTLSTVTQLVKLYKKASK